MYKYNILAVNMRMESNKYMYVWFVNNDMQMTVYFNKLFYKQCY